MTKIDKNMTKQFFKITMLVVLGLVGLSVVTQLKRAIVSVNSGSMTSWEATKFLFGETPRTTVVLMPIATLLGAMMTTNGMAKTSEIIALKTSGISFKRIIKYPIILSFIFSLVTAVISDKFSTAGRRIKRELKDKNILNMSYSKAASSNVYMRGQTGEYITHIGTVYGDLGELYEAVLIFQNKKGDLAKVITIESAKYDSFLDVWKGKNVYIKDLENNKEEAYTLRMVPELKEKPKDLVKQKFRLIEATFSEIRKNAIFIKASGGDIKDYLLEMNKRASEPMLVFIISFFGFALGSKFVRGGAGISVAIGLVLGFLTYIVGSISDAFVAGGYLNPALGAWIPCIIFSIVSIYTMNDAEY